MKMGKSAILPLFDWYSTAKRNFPWRETTDAYPIWLSEIMLQQTRTEQGLPYFEKFLDQYPSVSDLANASETEVFKLWQGLGYYSRARNLHKCAKFITSECGGTFPSSYSELLALPGVGPYTASAIGSFAFGNKTPVLDGNVKRVVSRILTMDEDIMSKPGEKKMMEWLNGAIADLDPATFNQAIMELGSLICTPKKPDCPSCPLSSICKANLQDRTDSYPIKLKKTKVKVWDIQWYYIPKAQQVVLEKGFSGNIWKDLHTFPGVITEQSKEIKNSIADLLKAGIQPHPEASVHLTHLLSHRKLNIQLIPCSEFPKSQLPKGFVFGELNEIPIPIAVEKTAALLADKISLTAR